jgi:phage portal protein BeeE
MLAKLLQRNAGFEPSGLGWNDYLQLLQEFAFNGQRYVAPSMSFAEFTAMQGARNPIVAAAIHARLLVFSEARFQFQAFVQGRPGRLFGSPALTVLENPFPGGQTGDLLAEMLLDVDLYGNAYRVRQRIDGVEQLVRLDPQRTMIVTGEVMDSLTGRPYGRNLLGYSVVDEHSNELAFFPADEVAHFRPLPDPFNPFRGRTWLSTVLTDATADDSLSRYKHAFIQNAATPQMVVSFDPTISKEAFSTFVERFNQQHQGVGKAFKTLFLGAGADVKVVGADFERLSMKAVQGAGETRIAAAAGVPASYLGISEGLAGSSLNAGNYAAARRRFADGTIRPLWRGVAGALQVIVRPPDPASRLWYDDRDVPFLQEEVLDAAEIRSKDASTMRQLVDGGFDPASVVEAVTTNDMSRLTHSGNVSVQLQPVEPGGQ